MDTSKFAGIPVLIEHLGVLDALKIGWRIEREAAKGKPWESLPKPENRDEALSREQIAPAILLYLALKERGDQEFAIDVVRQTAIAGGVAFLKKSIGIIDREAFRAQTEAETEEWVNDVAGKFFNADIAFDVVSADEVQFTVSRCRFPELCRAVGVPELSPVFCETDEAFFGSVQPGVTLTREETIARGGTKCPFQLTWDDKSG